MYLFPKNARIIGFTSLILALVFMCLAFVGLDLSVFNVQMPHLLDTGANLSFELGSWREENVFNEIVYTLTVIGGVLISFSRVKDEDEYIWQLRLQALLWAVYVSFAVFIVSLFLFYGFTFIYVLIANVYTILIVFNLRFWWSMNKIKS